VLVILFPMGVETKILRQTERLSSFGSVFTKTREKWRDKAPQERKNMREKAVLRN
jgi:hypothetical protein